MQIANITQKKSMYIEVFILMLFLAGMYYLYTLFSQPTTTTTTSQASEQLLGQNFVLFLKAVNQDKLSLRDTGFMNSELVQQLQDFSETISPTTFRGRLNPFTPYASTGSLR